MSKTTASKPDFYTTITNQIVAAIESGVAPWQSPWNGNKGTLSRPMRSTGEPYKGINVLLLWSAAMERGYTDSVWMTFKQALAAGGCVRKGEKGTTIVYAGALDRTEPNAQGEEVSKVIPFLKSYTVFNRQQIDGLTLETVTETPVKDEKEIFQEAEEFFNATGAKFTHGGSRAFYNPTADYIQLPVFEDFKTAEGYSAVKAHELAHWTGHKDRLDREYGKRFGDQKYAFEELVAEITSAFLCVELNVSDVPRPDHASYISSWLQVLKEDKRAIFTAASHAQKAVDYLNNLVASRADSSQVLQAAQG